MFENNYEIEEENKVQNGKEQVYKLNKNGEEEEDPHYNESQCNINETNDSFSERKNQMNIPSLKHNKNAMAKGMKSFSERILSGDLKVDKNDAHALANQMIFEINLLAGKMLIL